MNVSRDMRLMSDAMKETGVSIHTKKYDECQAIILHLEQSSGAHAYSTVTVNPMCGHKKRGFAARQQRKTRNKRAAQIRREMKSELQAVGLFPAGGLLWYLITSPTVWRFLFNWIRGVLADREET